MAKRRKAAKRRSSRRRVSGIGSTFTPLLGAVGGAIASKMLDKVIPSTIDPKIVNVAKIAAAGFLLPKIVKGPLGVGLSLGMASQAGVALLGSMGIAGVSDFYRLPTVGSMKRVAGMAKQTLGGGAKQVLAGVDLAKNSADVRRFTPERHNFATNINQLSVLSGFDGLIDG